MERKRKAAGFILRVRAVLMLLLVVLAGWSVPMIRKTHINYDLNRYLSDDTMTKRALKVMEEEFGSSSQLQMMFGNLSDEEFSFILETLEGMEEIRLVSHDPQEDVREEQENNWRLVKLTLKDCDAADLVKRLRSMFPEAGSYYVGGAAATQLDVQKSVAEEIPKVMLISVGIVLLVLLLTSHAWLEPVVLLLTLAVSILINMGTNFLFPDVSFITFAVCAILQLALSIDYAIMLLHTYNGFRDEGQEAMQAMTEALAGCFMRIASSALTTVAGLLSLLFMSFTIGFDIGLVLSKGIVISMLCVFLFMPGLVLLLERPLQATRHQALHLGGKHLAGWLARRKLPVAILLVLAVIGGAYLTSRNRYSFTDPGAAAKSETANINRIFGASNPLALLIRGGEEDEDYDRQRELVQALARLQRENGEAVVTDITSMVTTGEQALRYYTADEVAELAGLPKGSVRLFFGLHGFPDQVRADRLLEAAGTFGAGNETIAGLLRQLNLAKEALKGKTYDRILLEIGFGPSDPDFTACMDRILATAREHCGDDFYITGVSMSAYDIGNAFHSDLLKVNIITLLAIWLIVTISFRAFTLPALLVFVIEGAIWMTMGISRLIGETIFFISYLICLSIQMGATIDYGILLCDQYRSLRKSGYLPEKVLEEALHRSLPTIFTSGTILVTAGYVVGRLCSVYYISSIGLLLSRGAFVSAVLVLTLLPALLLQFDRYVVRMGEREKV